MVRGAISIPLDDDTTIVKHTKPELVTGCLRMSSYALLGFLLQKPKPYILSLPQL